MALPTLQKLKDYLRVETSAEDTVLTDILARAQQILATSCGKSLTTEAVEWIDDAVTYRAYDPVRSLLLRYTPVSGVTVTDKDGTEVDAGDYTVRNDRSLILAGDDVTFENGPYTIACTAGFGVYGDYATKWEPEIGRIIIDLAAFLYWQRTVGATSEKASQTTVTWGDLDEHTGLPLRIARAIRKLRGVVQASV